MPKHHAKRPAATAKQARPATAGAVDLTEGELGETQGGGAMQIFVKTFKADGGQVRGKGPLPAVGDQG